MIFTRDHRELRQATLTILEMVDEGMLDARDALAAAFGYMTDDEVEDMAVANQFMEYADDDDDYDGQPDEATEWRDFDPDC